MQPPHLQFPPPVSYQPKTTRSPFEESSALQQDLQAHPLQAFPLNALQFKGTVTQNGQSQAYVMAPDNKLYEINVGDVIGDHYGKITHIYPDHIEIEEPALNRCRECINADYNVTVKG